MTPYVLIGLGLTVWLLIRVLNNKNSKISRFEKAGVILTISIGIFSLHFGEYIIERLDWKLRRNSREEIIELIKAEKLKPDVTHNSTICTLKNWNIPPISNGGNQISIYKTGDTLTVEFFIDRDFLDHYSAFIYTNDNKKIQELERRMTWNTVFNVDKKLDKNWYRVSY